MSDKIRLSETILFRQIAQVLGPVQAQAQLVKAFNGYSKTAGPFYLNERLSVAFEWSNAPQGYSYWNGIHEQTKGLPK